jgi:hypothetical protein
LEEIGSDVEAECPAVQEPEKEKENRNKGKEINRRSGGSVPEM